MQLISHRIDFGKIQGPLIDYLNNNEKFQILNNKKADYSNDDKVNLSLNNKIDSKPDIENRSSTNNSMDKNALLHNYEIRFSMIEFSL